MIWRDDEVERFPGRTERKVTAIFAAVILVLLGASALWAFLAQAADGWQP